jgi:quercetin dioxygenase-like cupin family protein
MPRRLPGRVSALALLLAWGLGSGGCTRSRAPIVAGALPEGLDAFIAAHPLAGGQALRADEIARGPAASWHVVQVATAERPHRHRQHDLTVVVLRGAGVLTLDGRPIAMQAGDAAVVTRDRPHWFARRGSHPAVALVTFTPALDAADSVPEAEVDSRQDRR